MYLLANWLCDLNKKSFVVLNIIGFQIQYGCECQSHYNIQKKSLMIFSFYFKIAILCIVLTVANSQNTTNTTQVNITFAPPPPLNTSIVAVLNSSMNDNRFIGSKKLESLQLTLLPPVNNVSSTNFKLISFNRNAPNNVQVFEVNQTGNWSVVQSTRESLSCSLIVDANTQNYGFLSFGNNSLQVIYQSNSTLNINNTANITLRENCLFYMTGGLYKANSTGIYPVPTPASWNVTSSSESLTYGVAANVLYKFNPMFFNFTSVYTFPQNAFYDVRSYQGNLIVAASNVSNASANFSQINQAFYIFTGQASLSLINQFSIVAKNLGNFTTIPFLTSPQLSKLGVFYVPTNSTNQTAIFKSINFNKSKVDNLTFQQPSRILTTTMNIPPGNRDFCFGDNYYIIRNASAFNVSAPQFQAVEQAYQFVGTQIIFLRNRNFSTPKELNDYRMTFVDTFYQNQLVVLDAFALPSGLEIDEFIYGNLVSISRIIPAVTPPYITFTIPANSIPFVPKDSLSWVYQSAVANVTNLTIIKGNPNFTNNYQVKYSSFNGNQTILAMNDRCLILLETTTNNISIASPAPSNLTNTSNTSNNPFILQDVTQAINNASITLSMNSTWAISDNCDRFAVNNVVFSRSANLTGNQSIFIPIPFSSAPSSLDRNLATAVIGNNIWRLSPINNTFILALNTTDPTQNRTIIILPTNNIYTNNNTVVITATNSTSAQVLAFSFDSAGVFTPCLNFFFRQYQGPPKIQVSSGLTKVMIMGPFIPPNLTQIQPKIDAFYIDTANKGFQNITFPLNTIPDPVNSYIILDDQYLYVRSISTSNITNGTQPQENIFYINQNVAPQIAYSVNLTQDQLASFKRAVFTVSPNNASLNNYVEFLNGTQVIVNKIQTSPQQATMNERGSILGVTAVISNGKVRLCGTGCSDCSTGSCSGCFSGFAYDSTSYTCFKCGTNCASCSGSNIQLCYTCLRGSFLTSDSTCVRCDPSCTSCNATSTGCSTCRPTYVFINGTCNNTCPKNCITCSDMTTCTACAKGFILANGTCRGCAFSCSNCSITNITQCTSCAPGLSLVNSACVSCPDKCQTCNNGICATCIPGYVPNTAGVCVLSCAISCATCTDNQPTVCLSCYGDASVINGACVLNTTCNSDSSCTDCGQGLGYVLVGSQCVQCNAISNCLQCSVGNTCSHCMDGYYINSGQCSSCSAGCIQCSSADICTACAIGYTLPEGSTQGQCLQCVSPCATCIGTPTSCLTCAAGFTKKGWKCQNNTYAGFAFTLSDTPQNVLNDIDYIVGRLLVILGLNSTDVEAITFNSIVSGSTVVSGAATTSDPAAATATLSTTLSSGSLGTYTVTSSSVTVVGTESSEQKSQMGLIIGLVVGLLALVAIVVVVVYCIYKKKQAGKVESGQIVIELQHDSKVKNESKHESENQVLHPTTAMEKQMF